MADGPLAFEKRLFNALRTWQQMRPGKTFSGIDLQTFEAVVNRSLEVRNQIRLLDSTRRGMIAERYNCDQESQRLLHSFINSIRADLSEGEDGEVYRALGYVTKSERKSGRPKKAAEAAEAELGSNGLPE